MRFEAGSVFAGYTIVSRLGRGGMATVYLAREPGLDRLVALKVLPEQLVDDARFAARFEQEARVIAALDHPNIVPLYRYGISDDIPWMALRYVDGGDLAARLGQPLPVPEGMALLRGVALALDYAHRKGVIHRDLKPQNILLSGDAVYLADFGVAKLLEGSREMKTATGGIFGTPAYMAPEQARGLQLGPYTDVYALAVICFQWLTGNLPFDADTPQAILMKHALDPIPADSLRALAPSVAAVIQHGLAKRPDDRIQSASVFMAKLEQALAAPETSQAPTLLPPQATAPTRVAQAVTVAAPRESHRARNAFGALAFVLAACAGGYAWWRVQSQGVDDQRVAEQHESHEPETSKATEISSDAKSETRVVEKSDAGTVKASPVAATGQKTAPKRAAAEPHPEVQPPANSAPEKTFADLGSGVLKDNRSGLEWTQADNGADIGWNDADKYCSGRGAMWRLPSLNELTAIYDANVESPKICAMNGTQFYVCKTSPLFRLSSITFWSATVDGSTQAWQMNFFSGQRDRVPDDFAHDARALCVRQP